MKINALPDVSGNKLNKHTLPQNLIVFSHLRWDFVYQRPQHLLTRLSKKFNITFFEEPVSDAVGIPHYTFSQPQQNLVVVVPHLNKYLNSAETLAQQKALFDEFMLNKQIDNIGFWFYTPMALEFSRKYKPKFIAYDCMDELSAFKFAPDELKNLERELLKMSDIVFTGGQSLYEAKKNQHANIHAFPSSIEKKHFLKARKLKETSLQKPDNKKPILGFYGVIDERFDIALIKAIADERPDWQIKLIGPVVKIDQGTLPANKNIHYIGPVSYQDLPQNIATWDIALIPFLLNESTRFISPTKTPEYLAAGIPVASTPINDVINPYGIKQLVTIDSNAQEFITSIETELSKSAAEKEVWLKEVDAFLSHISWDKTTNAMLALIAETLELNRYSSIA